MVVDLGIGKAVMRICHDVRVMGLTLLQALLELHLVAQQHEDTHTSTYTQTSFLNPQVTRSSQMYVHPRTHARSIYSVVCLSLIIAFLLLVLLAVCLSVHQHIT